MVVERKKTLELKKHVATIHAGNKLTLLQRKIANALLYHAYETLLEKEEHEIHIGNLCKLIGYASNDHKTIKRSLVSLLSTVIEWNLLDGERTGDSEGVWNASSMIADASIDGALCTYSYSNKMRRLLYQPNMYGKLDLMVQSQFQSSYGLALYENCNRYQHIGQTPWIDLQKFRKLMGVEDGKYKIFRDFKSRVLDKAVEEVNRYSPLTLTPQLRKANRQVIAIQFLISSPYAIHLLTTDGEEVVPETLRDKLKVNFGLSLAQIETVLKQHDENYVEEKILLIESSVPYQAGKIKNLAKYLLSALRDDYQATKSSVKQTVTQKAAVSTIDKIALEKQKHDESQKLEWYRRDLDKEIMQIFLKKPPREKNKLLKEFDKHLGRSVYRNIYLRSGLDNVLVQDQLCLYLRQVQPEIETELSTFDVWLKTQR